MMADQLRWLWIPVAVVGGWFALSLLLTTVSRWRALQGRYPAREDPPLLTLSLQSGSLGWVVYRGCLTLKACPGGLRVSVWKLFAPFQRAFEVPWDAITAEPPRGILVKRVRLHLGSPELQVLEVSASSWARLSAAVPRGRTFAQR